MSEREKVDTYTIPPNFAESGKWFSGRVSAGEKLQISRPRKKIFMEALTDYLGGK